MTDGARPGARSVEDESLALADAGVTPEVAVRLLRALDRAPAAVASLIDADLETSWVSRSASWILGMDPAAHVGRYALERVHPDDVDRMLHGMRQLQAARTTGRAGVPIVEPLRYRVHQPGVGWVTVEASVQNLLDDPVVRGLLVVGRPVGGDLDGVGNVVDLLVSDAPLPEVLAACANLVPHYLGVAAVVALLGDGPVVGAPAGSPVERLAADDRWWRPALDHGEPYTPVDFAGLPDDLADRARAAGYRSVWILPLTEMSTGDVVGALAVWVRIAVEHNIATEHGLRQATRLATLVIGEQRLHQALRREAMTDPLTGLGNRAALRRRLDAAVGPVAVALVDLDGFKPINDTHGHDVGDDVLRVVGERIVTAVREDDCVVRFGGDEFAVVFADGTPAEGVTRSAARMRAVIGEPIAAGDAVTVTVGASVGVASAPPREVVSMADRALYQAKRAKRSPSGSVDVPTG